MRPWRWAALLVWCLVGVPGCPSGSGSGSPVVLAPPITPGGPSRGEGQDGRSGTDGGARDERGQTGGRGPAPADGGALSPYTGAMDAHELLTRSAMAYAQADEYSDRGRIAVGGRDGGSAGTRSYAFQTEAAGGDSFRFELVSDGPAPVRDLVVRKVPFAFEVVREGRFSKADSVEGAIAPLVADVGPLVAFAPATLFGDDGAALADDYRTARVLGRDRVSGRAAVVLELELVPGLLPGGGRWAGRATVWLDEPTLLVRRVAHTLEGQPVAIEFASIGGR